MSTLQTFVIDGQKYALVNGEAVPVRDANGSKAAPKSAASSTERPAKIAPPVPNGSIRAAFGGPAQYGPGCSTEGCGRQTAWDKRRGDWRTRCPGRILASDAAAPAIAKKYGLKPVDVTETRGDGSEVTLAYLMLPACERNVRKTAAEREADKAALKALQAVGRSKAEALAKGVKVIDRAKVKANVRILGATTLGGILLDSGQAERDILSAVVGFASKAEADRFAASIVAFPWTDYGWKEPKVTR